MTTDPRGRTAAGNVAAEMMRRKESAGQERFAFGAIETERWAVLRSIAAPRRVKRLIEALFVLEGRGCLDPPVEAIARAMECDRATVFRSLSDARRRGYVEVERQAVRGRLRSSRYTLRWDRLAAAERKHAAPRRRAETASQPPARPVTEPSPIPSPVPSQRRREPSQIATPPSQIATYVPSQIATAVCPTSVGNLSPHQSDVRTVAICDDWQVVAVELFQVGLATVAEAIAEAQAAGLTASEAAAIVAELRLHLASDPPLFNSAGAIRFRFRTGRWPRASERAERSIAAAARLSRMDCEAAVRRAERSAALAQRSAERQAIEE